MQRPILRMEVPKKSQLKTASPEELMLPPVVESMYCACCIFCVSVTNGVYWPTIGPYGQLLNIRKAVA